MKNKIVVKFLSDAKLHLTFWDAVDCASCGQKPETMDTDKILKE